MKYDDFLFDVPGKTGVFQHLAQHLDALERISDQFGAAMHGPRWHNNVDFWLGHQVAVPIGGLPPTRKAVNATVGDGIVDRGVARFAAFAPNGFEYHHITGDRIAHKAAQAQAKDRHHEIAVEVTKNLAQGVV